MDFVAFFLLLRLRLWGCLVLLGGLGFEGLGFRLPLRVLPEILKRSVQVLQFRGRQ